MIMLFSPCLVVVLLESAYFIGPSNAQPIAILTPHQLQRVCPGQTVSFNCRTNGTSMSLYGPPILNESQALSIFSSSPPQTCMVVPNRAGLSILVDDSNPSTFEGTLSLFIPRTSAQRDRSYKVFCRATDIEGNETLNSTSFKVSGSIDDLSGIKFEVTSIHDYEEMATVNVSWSPLDGVNQYAIAVDGKAISTIQSYIIITLRYGTFTATINATNGCIEKNGMGEVRVAKPMIGPNLLIAFIIIAALFLIISVILLIVLLFVYYKYSKLKQSIIKSKPTVDDPDVELKKT